LFLFARAAHAVNLRELIVSPKRPELTRKLQTFDEFAQVFNDSPSRVLVLGLVSNYIGVHPQLSILTFYHTRCAF
jgi:Na+/melibiose symporter-like transporter